MTTILIRYLNGSTIGIYSLERDEAEIIKVLQNHRLFLQGKELRSIQEIRDNVKDTYETLYVVLKPEIKKVTFTNRVTKTNSIDVYIYKNELDQNATIRILQAIRDLMDKYEVPFFIHFTSADGVQISMQDILKNKDIQAVLFTFYSYEEFKSLWNISYLNVKANIFEPCLGKAMLVLADLTHFTRKEKLSNYASIYEALESLTEKATAGNVKQARIECVVPPLGGTTQRRARNHRVRSVRKRRSRSHTAKRKKSRSSTSRKRKASKRNKHF